MRMNNRPKLKIPPAKIEIILMILNLFVIAWTITYSIIQFTKLPSIIPTGFDMNGKAYGFGNKASIFIIPAIALVVFSLITVLSRFPHIFNYPYEINEQNAPYQYRNAHIMLSFLKTELLYMFAFIEFASVKAAVNGSDNITGFVLIFLLGILATLIVFVYRAMRGKNVSTNL